MTFAEKCRQEHPGLINTELGYPKNVCPHELGYTSKESDNKHCSILNGTCSQCWRRVVPEAGDEASKTTRQTKAQLLDEITRLKEEVSRLERYSQYERCGNELYAIKTAFKNSGFTDEQAFALVASLTSAAFKK